jgi:PHD/YefM family antitoxin component YafN of YafNO toxin-antitoxin module
MGLPMLTFKAQDVQKPASQLQEAAMAEPVIITYHDRPRLVVMSMHE